MKNRSLNSFLKEKRVETGLSQAEVAKALGYTSPQFVSNWERGLVDPPLTTLSSLVDLYALSEGELVDILVSARREEIVTHLRSRSSLRKKSAKKTKTKATRRPQLRSIRFSRSA